MRLIDVDAMHKFVEEKVAEGKGGWANGVPYEWAYALTAADIQPTIDAEPVRHGRWYDKGVPNYPHMHDWRCSVCEYVASVNPIGPKHDFCPNCGAKMDLEVQDDHT